MDRFPARPWGAGGDPPFRRVVRRRSRGGAAPAPPMAAGPAPRSDRRRPAAAPVAGRPSRASPRRAAHRGSSANANAVRSLVGVPVPARRRPPGRALPRTSAGCAAMSIARHRRSGSGSRHRASPCQRLTTDLDPRPAEHRPLRRVRLPLDHTAGQPVGPPGSACAARWIGICSALYRSAKLTSISICRRGSVRCSDERPPDPGVAQPALGPHPRPQRADLLDHPAVGLRTRYRPARRTGRSGMSRYRYGPAADGAGCRCSPSSDCPSTLMSRDPARRSSSTRTGRSQDGFPRLQIGLRRCDSAADRRGPAPARRRPPARWPGRAPG